MKNIYSILAFAFVLFIIPLIDARVLEDPIKQNTLYDLKEICSYSNGTLCPISTICNITITDPNGNNIAVNKIMSNLTTNYPNWNVTLRPADNIVIGWYEADMYCSDGAGRNGLEKIEYQVTPSGNLNNMGWFIIIIVLTWGITLFGAYNENITLTMLGGLAMIIFGIYTLNNGLGEFRNFATESISFITIFSGAFFAITGGFNLINENWR